jgi:hypothetical protein
MYIKLFLQLQIVFQKSNSFKDQYMVRNHDPPDTRPITHAANVSKDGGAVGKYSDADSTGGTGLLVVIIVVGAGLGLKPEGQ